MLAHVPVFIARPLVLFLGLFTEERYRCMWYAYIVSRCEDKTAPCSSSSSSSVSLLYSDFLSAPQSFQRLVYEHLFTLGISLIGLWFLLRMQLPRLIYSLSGFRVMLISSCFVRPPYDSISTSVRSFTWLYAFSSWEYLMVEFFAKCPARARLIHCLMNAAACGLSFAITTNQGGRTFVSTEMAQRFLIGFLMIIGSVAVGDLIHYLKYRFSRGCSGGGRSGEQATTAGQVRNADDYAYDDDVEQQAAAASTTTADPTTSTVPSRKRARNGMPKWLDEETRQKFIDHLITLQRNSPAPISPEEQQRVMVAMLSEHLDSYTDPSVVECCSPSEPNCAITFPPTKSSIVSPSLWTGGTSLPYEQLVRVDYFFHTLFGSASYAISELLRMNLIAYLLHATLSPDSGMKPTIKDMIQRAMDMQQYMAFYWITAVVLGTLFGALNITSSPGQYKLYARLTLLATSVFYLFIGLIQMLHWTDHRTAVLLSCLTALAEPLRTLFPYPYIYRRTFDSMLMCIVSTFVTALLILPYIAIGSLPIHFMPFGCVAVQLVLLTISMCRL